MVPIKAVVRIVQNVEAVSEEDAIEKAKMIHDIVPDDELLREAKSKVSGGFNNKVEFDTTINCKYTARHMSKPMNVIMDSVAGLGGSSK